MAVVPSGPPASFKLDQARRGGLGAAVVAHPPPSASAADAVCRRLTAEVQRKLRLATEAEEKDDRDVICAEVFADVTGELNRSARGERCLKYAQNRPRASCCCGCRQVFCACPAMASVICSAWLDGAGSWSVSPYPWPPHPMVLRQHRTRAPLDILLHAHPLATESTGALYRRWFEVLAPYLCKERAASEALLALCRQLW